MLASSRAIDSTKELVHLGLAAWDSVTLRLLHHMYMSLSMRPWRKAQVQSHCAVKMIESIEASARSHLAARWRPVGANVST
jgi:hypothetical protein